MTYPGNKIAAQPDRQRRYQPGEHPSGPIGPLGPIREAFADGGDGLSGYDEYARPTRARRGRHASRAGVPDPWRPQVRAGGPAGAEDPATQSPRGPAHGYPPRPGHPGPQYPQGAFGPWDQAPPAAHQASAQPPSPPMAPAPTWADIAELGALPLSGDGSGFALAKRGGALDGYSDDEVEELAAGFAGATALAAAEPIVTGIPEHGPDPAAATLDGAGARPTMGSGRAAAAKERKAARRRGRRRRRVVVAGVSLPAIAAAAAVTYMHAPGTHAAPGAPSSPGPSAAVSAKSTPQALGRWQHIGTRTEDPAPLTLGQLFPPRFPAKAGGDARTAQSSSTDCARAVFGGRLRSAVRRYSCSQVMRASYLAAGQKLMGTIGVLNLGSSADASAVGKVTGSGEFIAQLAAPHGPTHNLTKGTGLEEAEVKGHYLILTWVEFTTLHAPTTPGEKAQLKTFSTALINHTANVSLTSRMVTGSPQMP